MKSDKKWTLFLIIGLIFFVCHGSSCFHKVWNNLTGPVYLVVLSGSGKNISWDERAQIENMNVVLKSTYFVRVPTEIKVADQIEEVELYGIENDFVEFPFTEGEQIPKDGSMPIILINNEVISAKTDARTIKWKNKECLLAMEHIERISRINGIFEKQQYFEADGYMNLQMASELLKDDGKDFSRGLLIKIDGQFKLKNIINELESNGYVIDNEKEIKKYRDENDTYKTDAIFFVIIILLLSLSLFRIKEIQKREVVIGTVTGCITSYLTQYMFPPQLRESEVFTMHIPISGFVTAVFLIGIIYVKNSNCSTVYDS